MQKAISKLENNEIENQMAWIHQNTNYSKMSNQELQQENKKILQTLKTIENKLDKELQLHKKTINFKSETDSQTNQHKIVIESIKSNDTLIKVLEKEVKKLRERRQGLKNGLQSKLTTKKCELEKKLRDLKGDIKKMKLQEKQLNKKFSSNEKVSQPQCPSQNLRLEQQIRVYSIKYMNQLQKYKKITQQVKISTINAGPQLHIPEQFYNQELEQRQEAQYKQYQGIVKVSNILSKRNDSENNKYHRIYSQKLRDLQKTIVSLGQLDKIISLKEGQLIEGKKNVELVKFKINNNEKIDDPFFSMSQSSLRKNSYSVSRLPSDIQTSKDSHFKDHIIKNLSKKVEE